MAKKEVLVITENELIFGEINQDGLDFLKQVREGGLSKIEEVIVRTSQNPSEIRARDILGEDHEISLDNLSLDREGPITSISEKRHRVDLDKISEN